MLSPGPHVRMKPVRTFLYAGMSLFLSFGIALATRIPVLKSEKAGYFLGPVNCFIALSESSTVTNAYLRMEASYSETA